MKTLELSEASKPLSSYAKNAQNEALVVLRRGKPFVALVDVRGIDKETLALSTDPKFIAILERSRQRLKREGGIPLEEIKRKYGLGGSRTASENKRRKRRTSQQTKHRAKSRSRSSG